MRTAASLPLVTLAAGVLAACGGPYRGACEPVFVNPGTWCVTVSRSDNTCGRPAPPPYEMVFTQAADALIATRGAVTYTGALCAGTGAMTGNDPAVPTTVTLTFAGDPSAFASGTSTWSDRTDPAAVCSGTDTFSALSTACP